MRLGPFVGASDGDNNTLRLEYEYVAPVDFSKYEKRVAHVLVGKSLVRSVEKAEGGVYVDLEDSAATPELLALPLGRPFVVVSRSGGAVIAPLPVVNADLRTDGPVTVKRFYGFLVRAEGGGVADVFDLALFERRVPEGLKDRELELPAAIVREWYDMSADELMKVMGSATPDILLALARRRQDTLLAYFLAAKRAEGPASLAFLGSEVVNELGRVIERMGVSGR